MDGPLLSHCMVDGKSASRCSSRFFDNFECRSRNLIGCPRIACIISHTLGVDVDKNVVYRVLAEHHRPASRGSGPSWLSFIGHTTDSRWSVDLFLCESIVLRSYWGLVVAVTSPPPVASRASIP